MNKMYKIKLNQKWKTASRYNENIILYYISRYSWCEINLCLLAQLIRALLLLFNLSYLLLTILELFKLGSIHFGTSEGIHIIKYIAPLNYYNWSLLKYTKWNQYNESHFTEEVVEH